MRKLLTQSVFIGKKCLILRTWISFPGDDLKQALEKHPGYKYSPTGYLDFEVLKDKDNDKLNVGEYKFICVETPGHTKGHICLYEPDKKILFSGDHILGNITAYSDENQHLFQFIPDSHSNLIRGLNRNHARWWGCQQHRAHFLDCWQESFRPDTRWQY